MADDLGCEATLAISARKRIDRACMAFEDVWKSGVQPDLEEHLGGCGGEDERAALLLELLRLDVHYRARRGDTPAPEEYLARYPGYERIVAAACQPTETLACVSTAGTPSTAASGGDTGPSVAALAAGDKLGRYVIRRALGRGGFGAVYLAWDEQLKREVAIKTPRPDRFKTSVEEEQFFAEVQTAAQLKHPAIVPVHDIGRQENGRPFVVMDYVQGQSLDEVLKSRKLPHRQLARIMVLVAEAVQYAHSRGFVHRDLKPANILLDAENKPLITDFGLAEPWKSADPQQPCSPGQIKGSSHYIPPEVYAGTGAIGPETDVYALGVTLYKALTGRFPFDGADQAEILRRVVAGEMPLPKDVCPETPEPLQRICLKAIERDPLNRYESAQMLRDDLRRYLEGREVLARPTRYDAELQGKLRNHWTEIRAWREERLITTAEMDRLMRPYWFMMDPDSPWRPLAERFPWETALVRLGGWLLLIGSMLWPLWYWEELKNMPAARVFCIGLPTLIMNLTGWLFWKSRSAFNAKIFLGIGGLLLPLFVAVLLSEYRWLEAFQGTDLELLATGTQGGTTLAPTNLQLTIAMAAFVAYCLLLVRQCGGRVFTIWLAVGVYALFDAVLLVCGLKPDWANARLAWTAVYHVGLCGLFCPIAIWWHARRGRHEAAWLFIFFPVPLAVFMTAMGAYGSEQWLGAVDSLVDNQPKNLWWMANGAVYALAAWLCLHSRVGFIRYWGTFFLLLTPISLLVPANLLFRVGATVLPFLGAGPFTVYELLGILFAVGLIVVGTKTSQPTLSLPSLIGLTVVIGRISHDHFLGYLSWPLSLALAGGLAILVGAASSLIRARLEYPRRR